MADTGAAATFEEGGYGAEHVPKDAGLPGARRPGYGDFQEHGAVRMAKALSEAGAAYPLVVAVPPDVPGDLRRRLTREGCVVREVHPLNKYNQPGHFAVGYYEGHDINYCHSKLCCIFQFAEYERVDGGQVVCLDADRIQALENMDDLFELDKGCMYVWMEYYSAGDKPCSCDPQYKIAYGNEESPDMVVWRAAVGEQAALLCNAAVLVHEPGMSFTEALLGKNRAAEMGAFYSNDFGFAPHEHGMPFGEELLGKNRIAGLAAPYSNADASPRKHGIGVTLGEPLLGKNRAAGQDAAPYSNAAGEALHATPAAPYAVQISIDEAMGAKAGGPIAVAAKAAGAAGRDARGRGGNLSAFVGIVAASSAVTAVAVGAASPAVAFGFFVVLLGGLSLAMSTVRGA